MTNPGRDVDDIAPKPERRLQGKGIHRPDTTKMTGSRAPF